MKAINEFITSLVPLFTVLMPAIMLLVGWWVNKQSRKTAEKQTTELKVHSDENRNKIQGAVTEATGTHKVIAIAKELGP